MSLIITPSNAKNIVVEQLKFLESEWMFERQEIEFPYDNMFTKLFYKRNNFGIVFNYSYVDKGLSIHFVNDFQSYAKQCSEGTLRNFGVDVAYLVETFEPDVDVYELFGGQDRSSEQLGNDLLNYIRYLKEYKQFIFTVYCLEA